MSIELVMPSNHLYQSVWDSIKKNKQEKKNWNQKGRRKWYQVNYFSFSDPHSFIPNSERSEGYTEDWVYRILKSIVFLVHSYYLYFITYGKFQIHTESKWYNETSMYSSGSINNYQFMASLWSNSLDYFEANARCSFIYNYFTGTVLFVVFWNGKYSMLMEHKILELKVSLELGLKSSLKSSARHPLQSFLRGSYPPF